VESDELEDKTIYHVVMNHEEQYSIWPTDQECPKGWTVVGNAASKKDCLAYINEVWKDMRPLSLRKKMEADAAKRQAPKTHAAGASDPS
jgi:MbtH protein